MKRSSLIISLLVLSLAFSACSAAAATGATTQPVYGTQNTGIEGTLSTEIQLAVGILLLEDSEQPISAEAAAELLPLWKAVRSLGSSSTTTSQEYQALFKQIQDTLPAEKMAAITAMQLTREDMMTLSEKLGISMIGGGLGGDMRTPSPEMLETLQAARESGQMPEMPSGGAGGGFPGGGMPAGGGGMPGGGGGGMPAGGGGMGPEMEGSLSGVPVEEDSTGSARARGGVPQNIPSGLLDAVIEHLQTIAEGK